MSSALVAIVGRPNVGKSTLFNRLIGRRAAIVEGVPGVTRDRHYADAEWGGKRFTVIDTGGFVPDERETLQKEVRQQAQAAVEECDLILFVVDGKSGRTAADDEVATYLRKSGKPLLLVVNKVDDSRVHAARTADFFKLGLGDAYDISAEHGRGTEALMEAVLDKLPDAPAAVDLDADEDFEDEAPGASVSEEDEGEDTVEPEKPIRIAIVGRPNVGKSTLVNAILGEDRLITSSEAGTTRDPIDSELEHKGTRFVLTDTAGIRRKSTISQRVEQFAVLAALKAIDRSDVAVLVLDANEPAVDQDARIAGIAEEKGVPLVVVVNKWDQAKKGLTEEKLRTELKYQLRFIDYAPIIFTSALKRLKVEKVLELARQLHGQARFRAPTPMLNKLLDHIVTEHPAPFAHGKAVRLYYCSQVGSSPPAFAFMANMPKEIPDRYQRYIVNQLRATFDLKVPIRLFFRERPGKAKRAARVARMKGRKRR